MVSNLNPSTMKITGTVVKHLDEVTKDGRLLRPYTKSPMIIQLIMEEVPQYSIHVRPRTPSHGIHLVLVPLERQEFGS
jgi:hypothetical protein